MKIRFGFVSNSSTSSFVCEICYHADAGMDACLQELGFVQCENGHVICEEHMLSQNEVRNEDDQFPIEACPICQLKSVPDYTFKNYLLKRMNVKEKDILDDIRKKFKNYDDFEKFLDKPSK
jgi:hypothetical protein